MNGLLLIQTKKKKILKSMCPRNGHRLPTPKEDLKSPSKFLHNQTQYSLENKLAGMKQSMSEYLVPLWKASKFLEGLKRYKNLLQSEFWD